MQWHRAGHTYWESDSGYRVAYARCADRVIYSAFAPAIPDDECKRRRRVSYAQGANLPQHREALGCFSTAEEARQACDKHQRGVS